MNYYSHHIGDYAVETSHLSMIEHGAYRKLLDMYYSAEAPLPLDLKIVARKAGARTAEEISVIETILHEFFIQAPEGWIHARCDEEISVYQTHQAEEQTREAHEKERMRRYRERRAEMFEALRGVGVVPAWNTSMKDLQRMYDERCTTSTQAQAQAQAPAQTPEPAPQQTCNAPATDLQRTCNAADSAPATAIPITNNQEPITKNHFEEDDSSTQLVTRAGEACLVVQKNGIVDFNPNHPRLQSLIERGATLEDFAAAAQIAKAAGKGFAYLLGVVDGVMADAIIRQARAVTRPKNRDSPETFKERDARNARERLSILCPGLVAPKHDRNNDRNTFETFDVEARNVTAIALG